MYFYDHYVITHSLLYATSQFDENTSLVGDCAYLNYVDFLNICLKICRQLVGNLDTDVLIKTLAMSEYPITCILNSRLLEHAEKESLIVCDISQI
jgi:hypothetical protein